MDTIFKTHGQLQGQLALVQRATAPELSIQNHSGSPSPSSSLSHPSHPHASTQERAHRIVSRSQSETVTHSVAKRKEMPSGRLKSEASLLKRPEVRTPRSSEQRRHDHSGASAAVDVTKKMVSLHMCIFVVKHTHTTPLHAHMQ